MNSKQFVTALVAHACSQVRNPEGQKTKDDASDFLDLMSLFNAVSVQPAKQDHILRTVSRDPVDSAGWC